ncbi:MAG: hypothetical protein Ct9H90mP9_3980 [Pseudomonadota bacterium]|nr:MAG: hypothetical protein Ct9H90mP9_3980 [Pseudomonadota bacterium]
MRNPKSKQTLRYRSRRVRDGGRSRDADFGGIRICQTKGSQRVYCELVGYGPVPMPSISRTFPEGPAHAVKIAVKDAGVDSEKIDYINTHGTSTPEGISMN